MKKKVLWISIIINIIFLAQLILVSFKYRETLLQKWIKRKHSADIVMFGDSHTANGEWSFLIEGNSVLRMGYGGHSSSQLSSLIPLTIEYKPKYVFILCGGNDIGYKNFSVKEVMSNFKFMADTLKKNNLKPVFQKLLYQHNSLKYNRSIDSINFHLTNYCLKEKIDLIDIGAGMYDSTGLKANLTNDKCHLNKKGYKIWSAIINNFLKDREKEE